MDAIAEYLIKVFVISLILYSYYHFLLRNRLMHNWNRFFLLGIFGAGTIIPLVTLPGFFASVRSFQPVIPAEFISEGANINFTINVNKQKMISPQQVIVFIYFGICLIFALSLLLSLFRLAWWIVTSDKMLRGRVVILTTHVKSTPFSFFRYIFWNNKINADSATGLQIMHHELIHVRQLHSLDRLFVNLLMIVYWVNPVFWLVRKELFMVHEFIADEYSIENKDPDEFARVLLSAAFPVQYGTVTNHFFTSPIKRRVHMLTQQQKTRFGYLSRLLALPILLLLIAAFSIKNKPAEKAQSNLVQHVDKDNFTNKMSTPLQDTVHASFPGGEKAWAKYISRQINKHLDSLQEVGKQGTTEVMFVIHEDGVLSDLTITKMEGTFLAQIVFDAIKNGPKWIPATSNGKRIRSIHKQPVTFQIQDEKEE